MFGSKQIPAVGISLGIERVLVIMEQILKDQNKVRSLILFADHLIFYGFFS